MAANGIDPTPQKIIWGNGQIFFINQAIPTAEELWLPQALSSGIPMNQLIGQAAFGLHRNASRGINNRLFRVRGRVVDFDSLTAHDNSFPRRGQEVSASLITRFKRDLTVENSIRLEGLGRSAGGAMPASGGVVEPLASASLNDEMPFFAVTRPAGLELEPGVLAAGEDWMVFGQADFGNERLDNIGGNAGFDSRTWSATLGAECRVNDNLNIGAGWTHLWNDIRLNGGLGSADIEGDAVSVYATYFRDNLWGDLLYSFGDYDVETRRNALGGTSRARPDLDAHRVALNLGYNILERDVARGHLVHGPVVSIDYATGRLEGYTETGNPAADTTFAEQNYDSLVTTAGWQATLHRETSWGHLRPQLRLSYGRENLDQDNSVSATFAAIPVVTASRSAIQPGENWMEVGVGVGFDFINSPVNLFLDYTGQYFRGNAEAHYVTVKAGWVW